MKPAVFLDRDGVLNHLVTRNGQAVSPRTLAEFTLIQGVSEAIERLRAADVALIVVTNQPDIARGFQLPSELERMHASLSAAVSIDAIYTCAHDDQDGCACRKPKAGLLLQAAEERQLDLSRSWMVGDTWKDLEAGRAAHCHTCLVRSEATDHRCVGATVTAQSLSQAVDILLSKLADRLPLHLRRA